MKLSNLFTVAAAAAILCFFPIAGAVFGSPEYLASERRKPAEFPEFSAAQIVSTEFMNKFEDYASDNFAFREPLRTLKAAVSYNLLAQKDNNGVFIVDKTASKLDYVLDEYSVNSFADKMNKLKSDYLADKNCYIAVVPDKNYYIAGQAGYPALDYERLGALLAEKLGGEYSSIPLEQTLERDCYYKTDSHWRQEKLLPAARAILSAMGKNFDPPEYEIKSFYPFNGVYKGQSALPIDADCLNWLVADTQKNFKVEILDEQSLEIIPGALYDEQRLGGKDSYDIFLSGATPIVAIENGGGEGVLAVFRDSFGSSIAPLFAESYEKVLLIDLRYIASPLVGQYVDFTEIDDVLLLYSTTLINNSGTIKVL